VQTDILAKNPALPLRIYAVWFRMVWGDKRERWPAEVLSDPRVVHLWDEEKSLGRWYSHHVSDGKHIVWDTFLLYPAGAPLATPPESLLAIGATIIGKRAKLREGVERLPPLPP
jgi:hypothetical protein